MPSIDIKKGLAWFTSKGWTPFAFQLEAWESYGEGISGLVNAPTGSGKTFSLLIPPARILVFASDTTTRNQFVAWPSPPPGLNHLRSTRTSASKEMVSAAVTSMAGNRAQSAIAIPCRTNTCMRDRLMTSRSSLIHS